MNEVATGNENENTTATSPAQITDIGNDSGSTDTTAQSELGQSVSPFASGKEKFLIEGKEHEWDWNTTKRYAQIGMAGHKAMEKAAALEKSTKQAWANIQAAAKSKPVSLLETLTGLGRAQIQQLLAAEYGGQAQPSGQGGGNPQQPQSQAELEALREEVSKVRGNLEQFEVERELKAIESEMDAAVKQFPVLDNPIHKHYVKAQYRNYLEQGVDNITIEDVAFHVAEEIKAMQSQKQAVRTANQEQIKKTTPVGGIPGAKPSADKHMSREDIRRLAGRV